MGGWYELAMAWLGRRPRELTADRGQSQVIGAILIFGFVIAGLGLYQVTVVPQQTSEVELQHSVEVQDNFANLHSTVVNAGADGEPRATSVKLGRNYPTRALALNPPPVQGSIRTESLGDMSAGGSAPSDLVTNVCGSAGVDTKALAYEAAYNRLSGVGYHAYETGATYESVDGKLTQNIQSIVTDDVIHLRPLSAGDLSTSGVGSESITFHPGQTGGEEFTVSSGNTWTLTLPTKLDGDQWRTLLSSEIDDGKIDRISYDSSAGEVDITFTEGSYTVRCTPVGANKEVSNTPSSTIDESPVPVGFGGESTWSPPADTQEFSAANGKWNGVDIDSIKLSDGQLVDQVECTGDPNPAKDSFCANVERLRLRFIIFNDDEQYTVETVLKDVDRDGDFDDGDICEGSGNTERCISEQRNVIIYDSSGNEIVNGELESGVVTDMLSKGGSTTPRDILLESNYNSISEKSGSELEDVEIDGATWVTSVMDGRITVEVS